MSWGGTVTWSTDREPTIAEFNRLEANLQWLYERIVDDIGDVGWFPSVTHSRRLLCDGSLINKTLNPEYADLVAKLKGEAGGDTGHPFYHADSDKAYLPNITDRFIRAMGTGRKAGEFQAGAVETHTHNTVLGSHAHDIQRRDAPGSPATDLYYGPGGSFPGTSNFKTSTVDLGTKASGAPQGASVDSETRPDNVTLYPLIRY